MKKSAQAASEFLLTYGWAILAVLVAVGALTYFGVINPKTKGPNSCDVGVAGITCRDTIVRENGNAELIITNSLPGGIVISSLEVADCKANENNVSIDQDKSAIFTYQTCDAGPKGSLFKKSIVFNYQKKSGSLNHTSSGQLITRVE